jgi:hypothetical protein
MISKSIVRVNKVYFAIFLFIVLFSAIHLARPPLLYMDDGSFRQFGIGYKQKTVVPIWLVAIILAIFSYLAVLYYLIY